MNYCEECGAKLQRGMNFCGNCGTPVAADESEKPLKSEEDSVQEEAEEVNQAPLATAEIAAVSPKVSKMKKGILAAVIAVALLAAITIVLWQAGVFSDPKKPADTKPVQTVDQENLYGTLDWKEDQDQEYALKNALIEGNSDANVKELFEESAYFTPKRYQYAMNGKDTYYQIVCQYEKEKKTIPYVLVFQVNEQEHLELAELYRKEKKIDKAKFDSFYKKLYKTKAQVEATQATTAPKFESDIDFRYFDEFAPYYDYQDPERHMAWIERVNTQTINVTIWTYYEDGTTGETLADEKKWVFTTENNRPIQLNESLHCDIDGMDTRLIIKKSDGADTKNYPYMFEIQDDWDQYPNSYLQGFYCADLY